VPGIVGLGEACRLASLERSQRHDQLLALRRRLEEGLRGIEGAIVHCDGVPRLPHTTHVAFAGVSGHQLMLQLDARGIAVSTGSACHSGRPQPSRTLLAMGVPESEALASLRISFGITNRPEEVDLCLTALAAEVPALRRSAVALGVT
jgi:cysteine desulfurase